jgi:hypothetical protein
VKGFLITLLLIVAGIAGLGLYRGWFKLGSDNAADESNVTLTVDKGKISEDKNRAVERVQGLGQDAKDKAAATTQKAKEQAAPAPR